MANEVVKLTSQQELFLDALQSPEIVSVPSRQRFRWAATKAGYSENTMIEHITKPILKQIVEVAERMMMVSSIKAAWTMDLALDGELDTIKARVQMDAAREIMDRAVPKKEPKAATQGPLVQIMLPAKVRITEVIDHIPTDT